MSIHFFFFIATYLTIYVYVYILLYNLERWRWLLSKMLSLTRSSGEFSASLFLCLPVCVKIICGITVEHVTPVTADLHWSQCSQTSLVLTQSINMWFRGSSQHISMILNVCWSFVGNSSYSANNKSLHLFAANVGHYYSCKKESLFMGNGLYLDVSEDRMQAFNLTKSADFGTRECLHLETK